MNASHRAAGLLALACAAVACSPPAAAPDAGAERDAGHYQPVEQRRLGLNDVTWLLPLPATDAGSPFPAPEAMLPRAVFDRVSTQPGDVVTDLGRMRLVAARFDLCDRPTVAPCADDADAVFRLVLQPLFNDGTAEDIALHAFYPVPRAEVPEVVDTLRALARLQDVPTSGPLRVNAALGRDAEFSARFAELIARYAQGPRLFRLTLFGQLTNLAALVWVFRGVEKRGAGFVRIEIPGIRELDQTSLLFASNEFRNRPQVDEPRGFARAMSASAFGMATPAEQREALEALAETDNPTLTTADTIQCVSCHVATTVVDDRARTAGLSVGALQRRYTSSSFDLTPLGDVDVRFRTLRALGYLRGSPLVAQRTVNETANVVGELEARFPPAP